MVVNVQVRSIRRVRQDAIRAEERMEVVASIAFVGKQAAWPVGSLQLRSVSEFQITPKVRGRGIFGSVSSPSIVGNTLLLVPVFSGTTGTRVASIATVGSVAPSGTVLASIVAYGY